MNRQRLVNSEELGDYGRALLRAGRDAEPPASGEEKLLASLGVGLALHGGSPLTGAALGKKALLFHKLAGLKWAIVGVGGVAVATGVAVQAQDHTVQLASQPATLPAAPHAAHEAAALHELKPEIQPGAELTSADALPDDVTRPAAVTATTPAKAKARTTHATTHAPAKGSAEVRRRQLAEEVTALDAVRTVLQAGDSNGALMKLKAYHLRFPNALLRPEANKLAARARHGRVRQ